MLPVVVVVLVEVVVIVSFFLSKYNGILTHIVKHKVVIIGYQAGHSWRDSEHYIGHWWRECGHEAGC